jgi:MarR family 2-MHQ and catechol resistance regulon transcriptional repressor
MKLEQAIQQSSFTSNDQKLTLNFIYTYNNYKEDQKNFFKPYDITQQQYNVLRILRGAYPSPYTTSQVRDRMLDKMSDASRIVERLVKKGLVNRTTTKSDKRLVDVVISDSGLELLKTIDRPLDIEMSSTFEKFTEEEREIFTLLLDKMRKR